MATGPTGSETFYNKPKKMVHQGRFEGETGPDDSWTAPVTTRYPKPGESLPPATRSNYKTKRNHIDRGEGGPSKYDYPGRSSTTMSADGSY